MNRLARALLFSACLASPWLATAEQSAPGQYYVVVDGKVDRATYTGWQVFRENCARCHGPGAEGTDVAPDLTERVGHLSLDQFRIRILHRYFLTIPLDEAVAEGTGVVEQAMEEAVASRAARQAPPVDMPRWRDNPDVREHIQELYAWLTARADRVIGPDAPELMPE